MTPWVGWGTTDGPHKSHRNIPLGQVPFWWPTGHQKGTWPKCLFGCPWATRKALGPRPPPPRGLGNSLIPNDCDTHKMKGSALYTTWIKGRHARRLGGREGGGGRRARAPSGGEEAPQGRANQGTRPRHHQIAAESQPNRSQIAEGSYSRSKAPLNKARKLPMRLLTSYKAERYLIKISLLGFTGLLGDEPIQIGMAQSLRFQIVSACDAGPRRPDQHTKLL